MNPDKICHFSDSSGNADSSISAFHDPPSIKVRSPPTPAPFLISSYEITMNEWICKCHPRKAFVAVIAPSVNKLGLHHALGNSNKSFGKAWRLIEKSN